MTDSPLAGIDPAHLRNLALNAVLQNIDEQVASTTNDPTVQMGILMMAQVLTFRRILAARQVVGRGQRMKFIALAVKDFERKLRQYHETKPGQVLVDDGKPDALTES